MKRENILRDLRRLYSRYTNGETSEFDWGIGLVYLLTNCDGELAAAIMINRATLLKNSETVITECLMIRDDETGLCQPDLLARFFYIVTGQQQVLTQRKYLQTSIPLYQKQFFFNLWPLEKIVYVYMVAIALDGDAATKVLLPILS